MSSFLFPRIGAEQALELIETTVGIDVDDVARSADRRGLRVGTFAVLGGVNVPEEHLRRLRDEVRRIAGECGYPDGPKRNRAKFDIDAAIYLYEETGATRGELLRDDVWRYFTCVLLPDVVCWRWRVQDGKEPHPDRFMGGVRNCIGRLWRRADVFRDERLGDPWCLVRRLLEDNVTSILERPKVARHRGVAREVARAFLLRKELARGVRGSNPTQEYLRQMMLRIRRQGGHVAFGCLASDELDVAIAEIADATLAAMGVKPLAAVKLLEASPELVIIQRPTPAGPKREGVWKGTGGLLRPDRRS